MRCTGSNCKSEKEIDSFFSKLRFSMPFINHYFDFNVYDEPIKDFIDDSLFFELENSRVKRANMYVSKSQVQLQDAYLQLGQQKELEFVQINNIRTYDDSNNDDNGLLVEVFIRLDSKYESYERQIYSFLELLGDVGGLQQSLFLAGFLLINFFSSRLFISSILK